MRKIWNAICDFFDYSIDFEALGFTLGILAGAALLAFAIIMPIHKTDVKEYNDGICSCGGHYEYSQAVGHYMCTTYIYTCDKCGTLIEIDYIP